MVDASPRPKRDAPKTARHPGRKEVADAHDDDEDDFDFGRAKRKEKRKVASDDDDDEDDGEAVTKACNTLKHGSRALR